MKNVAKGSFEEVVLEDGFFLYLFQNEDNTTRVFEKEINSTFIQLHFCIKGHSKFIFNNGTYTFDVLEKHAVLLYNTEQNLPINLQILPKTALVSVIISIEKFHSLFSKDAKFISFLNAANKTKKYYDDTTISPSVLLVLQQLLNANVNSSIKDLYIKGKVYELLSIHFHDGTSESEEYCPFLVDETYVLKIKKAKEIMINNMTEPPTLQELANEIGLNIKKLKEGFKQIYGDTVYSFLFNYKMEHARKLLKSNKFNVNEVGSKIGYSTASHFIAAFKKKFGTTPKKYVLSLRENK